MKLAFLGPLGTFTEQAALLWLNGRQADIVPFDSIPDVVEAVQLRQCRYGIVPVENAIEGAVNLTLDVILSAPDVRVVSECVLPIEQHLMALPNVEIGSLTEVWSHPQALAQCRTFLRTMNVVTRPFPSTAKAAHDLAEQGGRHIGVIGSAMAATAFALQILRSGIQDSSANETRFIVIGMSPIDEERPSKTMVLITPNRERAGVLASILSVFASFQLNLSWIESRPTRARLGLYQFILDVESALQEPDMQTALQVVRAFGHDVRVLGSYASWRPRPC